MYQTTGHLILAVLMLCRISPIWARDHTDISASKIKQMFARIQTLPEAECGVAQDIANGAGGILNDEND